MNTYIYVYPLVRDFRVVSLAFCYCNIVANQCRRPSRLSSVREGRELVPLSEVEGTGAASVAGVDKPQPRAGRVKNA